MRVIQLIGEIDEKAFKKFSHKLGLLESESNEPICLELSSYGGSDYDALAFYGRIRNSSCPIHVKAYGQILSAATLIFAACDFRAIDSQAWFMVHDSTDELEGTVGSAHKHLKHMDAMENQWANLLAAHSITPASIWRQLSIKTTFLTASEVLQLGLADEILKGLRK